MKNFYLDDVHPYSLSTLSNIVILSKVTNKLDFFSETIVEVATEEVIYFTDYNRQSVETLKSYFESIQEFVTNCSVNKDCLAAELTATLGAVNTSDKDAMYKTLITNSQKIGCLSIMELMLYEAIVDKGAIKADTPFLLHLDPYVLKVPVFRKLCIGGTYDIGINHDAHIKILGTDIDAQTYHFEFKLTDAQDSSRAVKIRLTDDLNRLPFFVLACKDNNYNYILSLLHLLQYKQQKLKHTQEVLQTQ